MCGRGYLLEIFLFASVNTRFFGGEIDSGSAAEMTTTQIKQCECFLTDHLDVRMHAHRILG